MTFEEWWDDVGHNMWCDNDDVFLSDLVKAAREARVPEGKVETRDLKTITGVDYIYKRAANEGLFFPAWEGDELRMNTDLGYFSVIIAEGTYKINGIVEVLVRSRYNL